MTTRTRSGAADNTGTVPRSRSQMAQWAAYGACACALAYAAMKLSYAAEGRLGLPGGPPVSEAAYDQYGNVALRQLGLVAVDLLAAAVALATVRSWGRIFPRWMLLAALGIGLVALAAGATAVLQNTFFGSGPLRWSNLLLSVFVVTWVLLWLVTAWLYLRGSRRR